MPSHDEQLFSTMFKLGPVMNSIRSAIDGSYISVNQAWIDGTGYSLEDVVGQTCDSINLPLNSKTCPYTRSMLETGKGIRNQPIQFRTKDGRSREGLTSAEIILVSDEPCLLTVTQDITEKNTLQSELALLERLKLIGHMAGGLGHEIRNPLTSVRGFLQLFREKYPDNIRQFDLMISEVDRANAIITDFIELAKTRPEKLALQSLRDVVNTSFQALSAQASSVYKTIKLELNEVPDVLLSQTEMCRAIVNLTNNAIDAAYPHTEIIIRTFTREDRVILEVENHGDDIDPEILRRLGTPFLTTKSNGTGLALAITYNTVKLHGGIISVTSNDNKTTFTVSLPITE